MALTDIHFIVSAYATGCWLGIIRNNQTYYNVASSPYQEFWTCKPICVNKYGAIYVIGIANGNAYVKLYKFEGGMIRKQTNLIGYEVEYSTCINKNNEILVSIASNNTVRRYSSDLTLLQTYNVSGSPREICVDKDNNIWVTLPSVKKIQKIQNNIVQPAINMGNSPFGICCDLNNNIWVSDKIDNTVQKLVNGIKQPSISVGSAPQGICVDKNNVIWTVCENSNAAYSIINDIVQSPLSLLLERPNYIMVDNNNTLWINSNDNELAGKFQRINNNSVLPILNVSSSIGAQKGDRVGMVPYLLFDWKYGDVMVDNNVATHVFFTDGIFTPLPGAIRNAEILVVGGGGSGCVNRDLARNKGGCGGVVSYNTSVSINLPSYEIVVGSGGIRASYDGTDISIANGTPSSFSNLIISNGGNGGANPPKIISNGITYNISGTNILYGKSGDDNTTPYGGNPKTGTGGNSSSSYAPPYGMPGNGGSGVVIIRYLIATDYMLIKNGSDTNSDIFTLKTGTPISLNKIQSQLTEDDFNNNGLLVSPITSSMFSGLSPQFNILTYSASAIYNNSKTTGTSFNKLILAKGDISLTSATAFNSVNLNANITGESNIKMIVSVDSGITWKTFNTNWVNINPILEEVNTNGITKNNFNAITKAQWTDLLGSTPTKIRFGYLLNQALSTELCNTDSIAINIDMLGSWKYQVVGATYDEFTGGKNGNLVTVNLYENGDFKINY